MEPSSELRPRGLPFLSGFLAELALLGFAIIWARLFHLSLLSDNWFEPGSILIGTAAVLPPWLIFLWTLKSKSRALASHRHLLEHWVRGLLTPMVTDALYDFVALVYLSRIYRPE